MCFTIANYEQPILGSSTFDITQYVHSPGLPAAHDNVMQNSHLALSIKPQAFCHFMITCCLLQLCSF
jgi:hypothetical protein